MINFRSVAEEVIGTLEKGNFYAECPCCGKPITLKRAGLFFLDDFTEEAQQIYELRMKELRDGRKSLRVESKKIKKRSEVGAASVNLGFIMERLAPALKSFRFNRNDCRSLFDPIDYVIFEGLSKKGIVSRIIFSDIKTGKARSAPNQREIQELVERKNVSWDTY